MRDLIALLITFVIFLLMLKNFKSYINTIFILFFLINFLGQRGVNHYPFTLSSNLPPFTILLFYAILIIYLIRGNKKLELFNQLPFSNLIYLLMFLISFAAIRSFFEVYDVAYFEPNDGLFRMRYFIKFTLLGLIYFIIISLPNSSKLIRNYIIALNVLTLLTAIITIAIYIMDIELKGVAISEDGNRIVWGGLGEWLPGILLINLLYFKFSSLSYKQISIILLVLGIFTIWLSKTRNQIMFIILPILLILLNRGLGRFFRLIIVLFLILLPIIFYGDELGVNLGFTRFSKFDDITIDSEEQLDPVYYDQAPHKLKPLLWSFYQTRNLSDFLFGHGLGFREYSGRTHYHSGIGYAYGSLGILGIITILLLSYKLVRYYRKYIINSKDLNAIIIEVVLAQFIALLLVSPFTGTLIQAFNLFGFGFRFGILEICRRNIKDNYQIKL